MTWPHGGHNTCGCFSRFRIDEESEFQVVGEHNMIEIVEKEDQENLNLRLDRFAAVTLPCESVSSFDPSKIIINSPQKAGRAEPKQTL